MKYLPIQQSHLKAYQKYSYHQYIHNTRKTEFTKVSEFFNTKSYHLISYNESLLNKMFNKYLNNDIIIIWGYNNGN